MVLLSADTLLLEGDEDVVRVRQAARQLAIGLGFSLVDQTKIVTAASEIARNTIQHGGGGTALLETIQPAAARFAARGLADRVGFTEIDSYRVGLVAAELATNLVKHARAGEVLLRAACDDSGPELELLAVDRGPGMANISASLVDGHSTTGSAGIGLGAVRRLSEEVDIHS